MSKCPYTWVSQLFSKTKKSSDSDGIERDASHLRVKVVRNLETTVDVTMPAHSARWLMDLIPDDVIKKIKTEGIPIEEIQRDLSQRVELKPQEIFTLKDPQNADVMVWLE